MCRGKTSGASASPSTATTRWCRASDLIPQAEGGFRHEGVVFVYRRSGTTWTHVGRLGPVSTDRQYGTNSSIRTCDEGWHRRHQGRHHAHLRAAGNHVGAHASIPGPGEQPARPGHRDRRRTHFDLAQALQSSEHSLAQDQWHVGRRGRTARAQRRVLHRRRSTAGHPRHSRRRAQPRCRHGPESRDFLSAERKRRGLAAHDACRGRVKVLWSKCPYRHELAQLGHRQ